MVIHGGNWNGHMDWAGTGVAFWRGCSARMIRARWGRGVCEGERVDLNRRPWVGGGCNQTTPHLRTVSNPFVTGRASVLSKLAKIQQSDMSGIIKFYTRSALPVHFQPHAPGLTPTLWLCLCRSFERSPYGTLLVANGILSSIGDIAAQTLIGSVVSVVS